MPHCTMTDQTTTPHAAANAAVALPLPRGEFVAMMAALMALNALAIDAMLPALKQIGASLHVADPNAPQFVILIFLFGIGAGAIVHGPLSDRYGRRPVLLTALVIYLLCVLGCVLVRSFEGLLAFRLVQGLASAAPTVVTIAVIRDRLSGDAMARLTSTVFMVFMIVPIIAPSVGQLVLLVADWHAIFGLLAVMAAVMFIWVWYRLPETLAPANVTPLSPRSIARAWHAVVTHRSANFYMLGSALIQGGLYGYLASGPQIFDQQFDAHALFPLSFAAVAATMAATNFLNSRIVERFGARRVSHVALVCYIILALAQVAIAQLFPSSIILFLVPVALNMSMVGLIGSNFGSIAMTPFGAIAGTASSFQTCVKTITATLIGLLIGQAFDSSALPMALGFLGCGLAALACILWAEHGRLFTRPGTTITAPM
jgi:MFS transporter, DHA1 family, multidrug resistance protein